MADYSLDIQFTQDQLQILYMAGSNVVVAKPSGDGSTPNVAWQVFKPMQANTLSWDEEYGIYASTSEVTNGAKLVQLSSVDVGAPMNKLFTLQPVPLSQALRTVVQKTLFPAEQVRSEITDDCRTLPECQCKRNGHHWKRYFRSSYLVIQYSGHDPIHYGLYLVAIAGKK